MLGGYFIASNNTSVLQHIVMMSFKKTKSKTTQRAKRQLEKSAATATKWIGSTKSLVVHTIIFLVALLLPIFGIAFERVLLVLTTILSLEAIYLAIFIQMTINKNTEDIEEIAEDVEEIQEDVEDIQKDVDEIQEDIEEIEEDHEKDQQEERQLKTLTAIQTTLAKLSEEIDQLKKK
jgi:hypothetical protein